MSDTQTHRFNKGKETTNAIFASMETSLPMDFTVNYGVRYTWVNSKLSKASASLNGFDRNGQYKNFDDGSAGKTGSDRNSRPVFNLSLNWTGFPDTSLRAGWSQGFRVPNLQEKSFSALLPAVKFLRKCLGEQTIQSIRQALRRA